jgi:hypothetical protein
VARRAWAGGVQPGLDGQRPQLLPVLDAPGAWQFPELPNVADLERRAEADLLQYPFPSLSGRRGVTSGCRW